jgi:hypothetical protein
MQGLSGVEAIALSSAAPFQGADRLPVSGSRDQTLFAWSRAVSPEYFSLTGIRLLRGRLFSPGVPSPPEAPSPVIVSEALARALSADADGQRVALGVQRTGDIVGVVADAVGERPGESDGPMLYRSIDTAERTPVTVLADVAGDPRLVIETASAVVRSLDPTVPVTSETIATSIARAATQYDAVIALSSASSALAISLCFVGLFGLMTFTAAQRTKEISIRLALGARLRQIVTLFMRSLLRPMVTGVSTGIPVALLPAVLLRRSHVLVAINPADPWPYGFALTFVIATVVAATLIPAIVAGGAEPSTYLRRD